MVLEANEVAVLIQERERWRLVAGLELDHASKIAQPRPCERPAKTRSSAPTSPSVV